MHRPHLQGNFVKATFLALAATYSFLSPDQWPQHTPPPSAMQVGVVQGGGARDRGAR